MAMGSLMELLDIAILSVLVFSYVLISARLEKTPWTSAILFTGLGWLLGPTLLDLIRFQGDLEHLKELAELTLALVLFSDAASANRSALGKYKSLPLRLLLLGLPATVALGMAAAFLLFPDLHWVSIGLLAVLLAPTDAALGKAVIVSPDVPVQVKESLNVESGLNDGICVPAMLFLLMLDPSASASDLVGQFSTLLVRELGIGLLVGCALAWVGSQGMRIAQKKKTISTDWQRLCLPALAFSCYSIAQLLEGSGFIASFCGGMLYGFLDRRHDEENLLSTETMGNVFAMFTWMAYGALIVGHYWQDFRWQILAYALLSLTLIRMLPVALSLIGTSLTVTEKLFVGWFGPRGLASVVFGMQIFFSEVDAKQEIILCFATTVTLSILLHGLSAKPFIRFLGSTPPSSAGNT